MASRGSHPRGAPHFTWAELGHPPRALRHNSRRLAQALEELRDLAGGRPLRIISAYRDPLHNARVGGARWSQHLRGAAADIPGGYATLGEAIAAGFTGIGLRHGQVVHVDVRPGVVTVFDE